MAITLRAAKKKGEILPETSVQTNLMGESGGGDGGGGSSDSGGSSGYTPNAAASDQANSQAAGYADVAAGYDALGPAPTYAGWGGSGSPLYGTGGGYSAPPEGSGIQDYTDAQAKGLTGGGGGGAISGSTKSVPKELWDAQVAAGIRKANSQYRTGITSIETPAQTSARNIAETSLYQKLINTQGAPPSGFSSVGGSTALNPGGGQTSYSTGLVPPGTGGTNLEIPVYDQQRVEALAQQVAAPGIRNLRNEVQKVQSSSSDNPNVKAMTLRQALQGYGSGLESVMGGALSAGASMYGQEYNPQVAAATTNYQGNLERELQAERLATQERISAAGIAAGKENQYQNAWNEWNNVWK